MKIFSKNRIRMIAVCLFFGTGILGSVYAAGQRSSSAQSLMLLNDVLNTLAEYYVDEISPEDLVLEAVEGLVASLDPHSELLDQRHRKRLMEQTRGEFGGIGIEISVREDSLTVLAPIPGTPGSRVGLQAGDRIVRIEHEPTFGMKLEDAVKRLKGKPETKVNIWVRRIGVDQEIHFEITRAIIKIESVQAKFMITPEIGYVRLGVFSEKSGKDLDASVQELRSHGMKKLIFDLRDNPGGLLSRAVDVSDLFLDPGQVIVSTRGRIRHSNRVYRASAPPIWPYGPIITLISGGSASASEIVSGALQDHDKAVIMGTTSFGKASVQTIIDLRENYALKLTTAKYYTPSGRCIHADRGIGDTRQALLRAEDTLRTFLTDSGRQVRGGGGITPDLIVKPDSLTEAERKIFRKVGLFRSLIFRYAVQYKNDHPEIVRDSVDAVPYTENFREKLIEITPEMLAQARQLMKDEGFDLTEAEFDRTEFLTRPWMCYYIADACYDRNTAQRVLGDFDEQLGKAVELIANAPVNRNFVETMLAGRTLPDTLTILDVSR